MENPHDEELIAYLDGELDPSSSQQVEERLKQDPKYRRALTLYERSWDMLDRLERSTVDDSFTRSTMEMISMAAAEEKHPAAGWSRFGLKGFGILALLAMVGLALGYSGGRAIWPDPNRELLEDLPILEDLALYEQAGSIEFLRELSRAETFNGAGTATKMPGLAVPEAPAERRAEIERMPLDEREHLSRRLARFSDYSTSSQQRLRSLHNSLNHDGDGIMLRNVLVHYHEWLDTLSPSVRKELDDLSDEERIARIVQIRQERAAHRKEERKDGPTDQDLMAILTWLDDFAWQHREKLFNTLSDKRRKFLKKLDETHQRQALVWMLEHRGAGPRHPGGVRPGQSDIDQLADHLSPSARERLAAASAPVQERLVHRWMQIAHMHRFETVGMWGVLPPIAPGELQRFAAQELSDDQRNVLVPMTRTRRVRELWGLYFLSVDRLAETTPDEIKDGFPVRTPHHPQGGPGPDGPPPGPPPAGGPEG